MSNSFRRCYLFISYHLDGNKKFEENINIYPFAKFVIFRKEGYKFIFFATQLLTPTIDNTMSRTKNQHSIHTYDFT